MDGSNGYRIEGEFPNSILRIALIVACFYTRDIGF